MSVCETWLQPEEGSTDNEGGFKMKDENSVVSVDDGSEEDVEVTKIWEE